MIRCLLCTPARVLVWTVTAIAGAMAVLSGLPACIVQHVTPIAEIPKFPFQNSALAMEQRARDADPPQSPSFSDSGDRHIWREGEGRADGRGLARHLCPVGTQTGARRVEGDQGAQHAAGAG